MVRPTWSVGLLLFNGANDVDFKICDDGRDYFRAGLPLSLVYSTIVIFLIPRLFPF